MERFAALLDALVYTSSRNAKLRLIADYLRETPDPDRGWALAALTDGLDFPAVKASTVRNLMQERVDPVLWALSRDFVGDTAETASLLWPEPHVRDVMLPPTVAEAVAQLATMTRATAPRELAAMLDRLDSSGRYALIKLATGANTAQPALPTPDATGTTAMSATGRRMSQITTRRATGAEPGAR